MDKLKVGDILIAKSYCGFPDHTTKDKEYTVTKVDEIFDGRTMFWIVADNGEERFPISTTFKRKAKAELSEEEILKTFGVPKVLFDELDNESTSQSYEQFKEHLRSQTQK